ncbi:MAG TPA: ribosomal protein L7/L12, partial [Allocoleopsis sp.]
LSCHVNLSGANLTYANLSGANLKNANLTVANLSYANLTGADLTGANLYDSDLTNANLTNANLIRTNLVSACLDNTNFSNTLIILFLKALSSANINLKHSAKERLLRMGLNRLIPTLTQKYSQELDNVKNCVILLNSYPNEQKIATLKYVRKITGLGLKDAKDLIESCPTEIMICSTEEAQKHQQNLEQLGANVTIIPL